MSALNDWFNGHFWQSNMYRTFDCCQERKQETGKIQMYLLTTAKSVKFMKSRMLPKCQPKILRISAQPNKQGLQQIFLGGL